MEEHKDMNTMLEMIMQPSFCVENGIITLVNQAARQLLIEAEASVLPLLGNDAEEYQAFESGCLCLTLMLSGCPMHASVTRMNGFDLFVIDQIENQAELKAMALTALGIREPLSDIMAITDQLFPAMEAKGNDLAKISQMNRRLNQLHRMVCNMTDAIQYTSDTAPRMVCQDVCSVVEEIFERITELATHMGIRVIYTGPREPVYSMIAPERLERAIYNIASNAMKHTAAGNVIEAKLTHRGSKLYLSVQDGGDGIPAHMIGNIYSRYRRQPAIEPHASGLGLGMVLIRGTAAVHGGTVLIDQPGKTGTRITISITVRRNNAAVHSPALCVDYAGERDHALLELSEVLPAELYKNN